MTTKDRAAELATLWIEAWNKSDMDWLRRHLAPDFVHISPFGRLEGREDYLATVEPLARQSVTKLVVKDVIASGTLAAVRFENRTPKGVVETCDWIRVENGLIKEIRSFFDSVPIQEILSPAEQKRLDGSS
jgi:ketosteroid isomerase-like protein